MPTMGPMAYPFDPTGTAASNLITNEIQTITPVNHRNYHFVIPQFGPFFADSLEVSYIDAADVTHPLTEGMDYNLAAQFIAATSVVAKPIYGAISLSNLTLAGRARITYQTLGGEYTVDIQKMSEIVANLVYNPRTISWEQISGVPVLFPPIDHYFEYVDVIGQAAIVNTLDEIVDILLTPDLTLDDHVRNLSNPHETDKDDVGLSNVMNYAPATIEIAVLGNSHTHYLTPAGMKAFCLENHVIPIAPDGSAMEYVNEDDIREQNNVNKIVTFDMLLAWQRLHGNNEDGVDTPSSLFMRPVLSYPLNQGFHYLGDTMRTMPFLASDYAGHSRKTIQLSGTGNLPVPPGVSSITVVGRGGSAVPYAGEYWKVDNVSGMESGYQVDALPGFLMRNDYPVTLTYTNTISGIVVTSQAGQVINDRLSYRFISSGSQTGIVNYKLTEGSITNTTGPQSVVRVGTSTLTYEGSSVGVVALPARRTDDMSINPNVVTEIIYSVPLGTEASVSYVVPSTTPLVHQKSIWEISNYEDFRTVNVSSEETSLYLSTWVTSIPLIHDTKYFLRVKWLISEIGWTQWSAPISFTARAGTAPVNGGGGGSVVLPPTGGVNELSSEPTDGNLVVLFGMDEGGNSVNGYRTPYWTLKVQAPSTAASTGVRKYSYSYSFSETSGITTTGAGVIHVDQNGESTVNIIFAPKRTGRFSFVINSPHGDHRLTADGQVW